MLELQDQGALNINLVTPSHYPPHVVEAIRAARDAGLELPIVCNTSGYETAQTVRTLAEIVDVWLTDYKYASPELASKLSGARDYPQVAHEALGLMLASLRASGGRQIANDNSMQRGIIVRHLVLPGQIEDSCAVLDCVWELCGNEVDVSIMNQYTPNERCRAQGGELARPLGDDEYEIVLCHADDLGFDHLWWQQGGTVSESFVPDFDATGVVGPKLGSI
jgi:putative pyruvate formate lyase activating enzyme